MVQGIGVGAGMSIGSRDQGVVLVGWVGRARGVDDIVLGAVASFRAGTVVVVSVVGGGPVPDLGKYLMPVAGQEDLEPSFCWKRCVSDDDRSSVSSGRSNCFFAVFCYLAQLEKKDKEGQINGGSKA